MRLAKFLSQSGVASRRKAEKLIVSGKVSVGGITTTKVSTSVSGSEEILFEGQPIKPKKKVYYLLNKPIGVTSTGADPHAKKVITELVPKEPPIWPVGRLDRDTSGLIILTNDGELTQRLTHPSFIKEKEYLFSVDRPLSKTEQIQLRKGITLEDGFFKPDKFIEISTGKYLMTIHEGRNRLVRRSVSYFGKEITTLTRTRIADIKLLNLAEGKYRILTKDELERLQNA